MRQELAEVGLVQVQALLLALRYFLELEPLWVVSLAVLVVVLGHLLGVKKVFSFFK